MPSEQEGRCGEAPGHEPAAPDGGGGGGGSAGGGGGGSGAVAARAVARAAAALGPDAKPRAIGYGTGQASRSVTSAKYLRVDGNCRIA